MDSSLTIAFWLFGYLICLLHFGAGYWMAGATTRQPTIQPASSRRARFEPESLLYEAPLDDHLLFVESRFRELDRCFLDLGTNLDNLASVTQSLQAGLNQHRPADPARPIGPANSPHSRLGSALPTSSFEASADGCTLRQTEVSALTGNEFQHSQNSPTAHLIRYPYPVQQYFAAYEDDNLPNATAFHLVQCHDISPGGISVLTPDPLDTPGVISIGTVPNLIFMAIKPMNSRAVFMHGMEGYLNGCKFVRRLDSAAYAWDAVNGAIVGSILAVAGSTA